MLNEYSGDNTAAAADVDDLRHGVAEGSCYGNNVERRQRHHHHVTSARQRHNKVDRIYQSLLKSWFG